MPALARRRGQYELQCMAASHKEQVLDIWRRKAPLGKSQGLQSLEIKHSPKATNLAAVGPFAENRRPQRIIYAARRETTRHLIVRIDRRKRERPSVAFQRKLHHLKPPFSDKNLRLSPRKMHESDTKIRQASAGTPSPIFFHNNRCQAPKPEKTF